MKKLFFLLLIVGSWSCNGDGGSFFTADCLPANLQTGLIAFYPFTNGSISDESGNPNDLFNPTSAKSTSDRNGNFNCAYLFENTSSAEEYLSTFNTDFLNDLDAFSVSIWYEPLDTNRNGGNFETLLGRGDEGRCPNRSGEWSVGLYDCRRAVFGHNNSVWANLVTDLSNGCQGEVVALTNQWHHVVAVKDKDLYQIYFNGTLQESETGNAACTNLRLAQNTGDLFIGSSYHGKLDDILIYDRALSSTEVTELYRMAPCCE